MKSTWSKQRAKEMVAGIAILCATASAFAQYVWIDEKGTKQYSDRPPPPSTPASKIIKGSRGHSTAPATAAPAAEAAPPVAAGTPAPEAKAPMTTAERNADFQKRKLEQEAKEKKAAEEAKNAENKKKTCDAAKANKRLLDSGERIARQDANGERSYMTDEERAKQTRETNQMLDECK